VATVARLSIAPVKGLALVHPDEVEVGRHGVAEDRLFVFVDEGEDHVLVNPVLTKRSKETSTDEEGCLSIQGVLVPVERSLEVTIEGADVSGEPQRFELVEPTARIAQHELDHLDGVLIIDRTDEESRRNALAKLRPQPVLGAR